MKKPLIAKLSLEQGIAKLSLDKGNKFKEGHGGLRREGAFLCVCGKERKRKRKCEEECLVLMCEEECLVLMCEE
jgi:hypothetical protein